MSPTVTPFGVTAAPEQGYRKTWNVHRLGPAGEKPPANQVLDGTLYFSTDTTVLERSNGATWEPYAAPLVTQRSGVFNYVYNSTLVEPPSAGQARLNTAAPWTGATKLWLRFVSAADQDLYWGLMLIDPDSVLLLQDKDDHTRYLQLVTTGTPIDKGLYAELPVVWRASGTGINTASPIFVQVGGVSPSASVQGQLTALQARVQALEQRHGE